MITIRKAPLLRLVLCSRGVQLLTGCLVIKVVAVLEHGQDLLRPVGRDEHIKDGHKASGVVLHVLGVPAVWAAH